MRFLDKILYKIGKRLFRKYMNELVEEFSGEIVKRSFLVLEIADKYFEHLEDSKTKMYLDILIGEVHAKTDNEAVEKTERLVKEYYERIEEIEKVKTGFHKIAWIEMVTTLAIKLTTIVTLFTALKQTIEALKTIPLGGSDNG